MYLDVYLDDVIVDNLRENNKLNHKFVNLMITKYIIYYYDQDEKRKIEVLLNDLSSIKLEELNEKEIKLLIFRIDKALDYLESSIDVKSPKRKFKKSITVDKELREKYEQKELSIILNDFAELNHYELITKK